MKMSQKQIDQARADKLSQITSKIHKQGAKAPIDGYITEVNKSCKSLSGNVMIKRGSYFPHTKKFNAAGFMYLEPGKTSKNK